MDDRMYKEFLESQLRWSKNQISILDDMESKLLEMKKVAEYAAGNELSIEERETSSKRMEILNQEYHILEKQKHTEFH
ncbi:hypothetical protein [Planomicrobium sp. Y74]|uniref:hypothetical protein n=1 Tax=Planomicrobium sp. Y74 TaxID=2478977 RepID=UPI000EF50890|nr:hypothetical protein [Planomicrobium sp. Y74]RLQ91017.1 hypothetical protein D9754_09565 [Planomicrobium sp. Y74]